MITDIENEVDTTYIDLGLDMDTNILNRKLSQYSHGYMY